MPIYMDRHELAGMTAEMVAQAHLKDLAIQDRHGVKFLTYWFDEARGTAGTVKLSSKGTGKRRSSLEPQTYAAALAPVISAHIAKACARTARYSAAGR